LRGGGWGVVDEFDVPAKDGLLMPVESNEAQDVSPNSRDRQNVPASDEAMFGRVVGEASFDFRNPNGSPFSFRHVFFFHSSLPFRFAW
jgi:hypothetical protein